MQQYNCQVGQSWFDVCTNTYGTLDYIGKLLNDNNASLDVFPFTGQQIQWDNTIVKDSSVQALISANGYVFNTGNNISNKIQSYTAGTSTIDFINNGGDGWNVTALLEPTTFTNIPDGLTVDSTHFDIEFWSGGSMTTIYDNTISADQTENTGANGAGVYYVAVTYSFTDGTAFVVYGYYLVNATNTILKSVVVGGVTVNSVSGLVMDIAASVVQTNCAIPCVWIGLKADNSSYVLGSGDSGTFTLQPSTTKIVFKPLLEDDTDFSDYNGDPTAIQTIIIS
jgi:hypothetical protein